MPKRRGCGRNPRFPAAQTFGCFKGLPAPGKGLPRPGHDRTARDSAGSERPLRACCSKSAGSSFPAPKCSSGSEVGNVQFITAGAAHRSRRLGGVGHRAGGPVRRGAALCGGGRVHRRHGLAHGLLGQIARALLHPHHGRAGAVAGLHQTKQDRLSQHHLGRGQAHVF